MKALTVQQPWAWAIIHGGKDVENRTQAWGYRGPLAIHAGARLSERGLQSPLVQAARVRVVPADPGDHSHDYEYGAIIGVVDLVDVHEAHQEGGSITVWADWCCHPWGEGSYAEHGGRTRRDVVHLVLENPRPLAELIPCRGQLGLWTAPADVTAAINQQLEEA